MSPSYTDGYTDYKKERRYNFHIITYWQTADFLTAIPEKNIVWNSYGIFHVKRYFTAANTS